MDKIYVDYNSLKSEKLRDLEYLACDELVRKVNGLKDIVTNIENNWHGSNAERYRAQIEEIIEAIDNFKKNCLEKNLSDIAEQVEKYKNNEEMG